MLFNGRRKRIKNERWREMPKSGNRYFVSNYGRVKSFVRDTVNGEILKGATSNGYKIVQLNYFTRLRKFYVHKLVAEIWLEQPSNEHTVVVHLDHDKTNNYVLNLKWLTKKEYIKFAADYLRESHTRPDCKIPKTGSKLKYEDIALLKSMILKGVRNKTISQFFCISKAQVDRIKKGVNWGYVQPLS